MSRRSMASAMPPIGTTREKLAQRKKEERAHTSALWARLELLAPNFHLKALGGRTRDELLKDVMHALRLERGLMVPGALEQAYTSKAGAGLIAIELNSGKIVHQSASFQVLNAPNIAQRHALP